MVPNSRITSWESWFISNLQRNKQLVTKMNHTNCREVIKHEHWIVQITHNIQVFSFILLTTLYPCTLYTYLSGYPLKHLANMFILASSSGSTELLASSLLYCIFPICLGPPSNFLFVPHLMPKPLMFATNLMGPRRNYCFESCHVVYL